MRRVLASLLLLLAACSGGSSGPAPLVVGTEARFPPFESVAEDGLLVGFDIELMQAIGDHLGRRVEFRNMDFDPLIPDLVGGRIDAIASGMSYTDERAKTVLFSRPYARVAMGVLVSTSRAPDVTSPEQLDREGVVLAVQRKTTGEEKARAHFPAAQIRTYDNELDAANEVAAGRADAFVYDMVSVVKLHNRHRNATHIVEADLGTELYCIAWRKGSEEAALVDAFLARESRPGGLIDQMLEKWLGDAARFRVDED